MKKVLIFGGGLMGKTVAEDLLRNGHEVTIADIKEERACISKNVSDYRASKYQYFNAKDLTPNYKSIFGAWLKGFDLAIGALPSEYGAACVSLAAYHGVDFVDLTFTGANLLEFNDVAAKNGCLIIPDCGVAPGLSNLIVGGMLAKAKCSLSEVKIYVGGIAANKSVNKFGYVRTWSIKDLYQEYIRPGRVLINGRIEFLPPPLSQSEDMIGQIEVEDVGTLETFVSDGVRTLLGLKEHIPTIIEKTLRWPGHLKEVQERYKGLCDFRDPTPFEVAFESLPISNEDLLVMVIEGAGMRFELIDYGTREKSAMARTTAHTCAAFAEMVLQGRCAGTHGVVPPELLHLGQIDPSSCYNFIFGQLKQYGVIIKLRNGTK